MSVLYQQLLKYNTWVRRHNNSISVGIQALISNTLAPRMHVGFLPYLQSALTEYSIVFSVMKNSTQLVGQLKQNAFPLFCDEGVFRILVNIFFRSKTSLEIWYQFLVDFNLPNVCNICQRFCIGGVPSSNTLIWG